MLKKNRFNKIKVFTLFILLLFSYSCSTSYIPQLPGDENLENERIFTLSNDGQEHYVQRGRLKRISIHENILVFSHSMRFGQNEEGIPLREIYKDDPFSKALKNANDNFYGQKKNETFARDTTQSSLLNKQTLYSEKENGKNVIVKMGDINFKTDIKLVSNKDNKIVNYGKKAIGLSIEKEDCLSQFFFFVYKNMKREQVEKIVRRNHLKFLNKYTPEDCRITGFLRENGIEMDIPKTTKD